jgi:hypothetical protein
MNMNPPPNQIQKPYSYLQCLFTAPWFNFMECKTTVLIISCKGIIQIIKECSPSKHEIPGFYPVFSIPNTMSFGKGKIVKKLRKNKFFEKLIIGDVYYLRTIIISTIVKLLRNQSFGKNSLGSKAIFFAKVFIMSLCADLTFLPYIHQLYYIRLPELLYILRKVELSKCLP